MIELTHYRGHAGPYSLGSAFGYLPLGVPDVYETSERVAAAGVNIPRPAGPMAHGESVIAFIENPDDYRISASCRRGVRPAAQPPGNDVGLSR